MKSVLTATTLGTAMMTTAFAQAAPEADHSGVLLLDAQAVTGVPTDTITLTLSAEQEGTDPGAISTILSRKADDMISQAKRTSGMQAEASSFNICSNTDRNGKISMWRGRAEVRITSRDFTTASKLAGQPANQVQVQNVNFTLLRKARTVVEARLIDQAASSFRDKALTTTKLLGYMSYTIRDMHVNEGSNNPGPRPVMRMATAPASFDSAPIPIEGNKAQVTVAVSGTTQMLK